MKINMQASGGFENTKSFLLNIRDEKYYEQMLHDYGRIGVNLLMNATPKDSGETAMGWRYRVQNDKRGLELFFYNIAHPETEINIAILLEVGHATKSGGFVSGMNYINPIAKAIYQQVGTELVRRLKK